MTGKKTSLVKASGDTFPDTRELSAQKLATFLDAEPHKALWISGQRPNWSAEPRHLDKKLPNSGGISKGNGVFLPLYLPLWTGEGRSHYVMPDNAAPTLIKKGSQFTLAGPALEEFQACQKKMVALGLIKEESDAKLVINKHHMGNEDEYVANIGVEADKVDVARLQELREHLTRSFKVMRLFDHAFGLEDTSVSVKEPETRDDRVKIIYTDLSPKEFAQLVKDSDFARWAEEEVEIQAGVHTGLPRGFPVILAPFVLGGPPTEKQAAVALDGEDPDLYRKMLKLSVLKDYVTLAGADNATAKGLVDTLQAIADGKEPPERKAAVQMKSLPEPK